MNRDETPLITHQFLCENGINSTPRKDIYRDPFGYYYNEDFERLNRKQKRKIIKKKKTNDKRKVNWKDK